MEGWALSGAVSRATRRDLSSDAERADFYDAAMRVLPAALDHLDRKPLRELDASETRLMNLMLSLCHVALAVEMQRDDEAQHAQRRQYLRITRASSDCPC